MSAVSFEKAPFDAFYIFLVGKLKEARKAAGVTQETLAESVGRDQSWVSKVESGELALDIVGTKAYCRAIGRNYVQFLAEAEVRFAKAKPAGAAAENVFSSLPADDRTWTEENWYFLLTVLVAKRIVSYKEIAALVLGQLNPPQVGTSIASNKAIQAQYPKRKTWQAVRTWFYMMTGKCEDCGSRLDLQADHVISREDAGTEAERLDNLTLRCRRCNVIRRPSHKKGGITFLTAEAALMWLLFTRRPTTYQEFERLCRDYKLSMANIRFQEAWAMARWLKKEGEYEIAPDSLCEEAAAERKAEKEVASGVAATDMPKREPPGAPTQGEIWEETNKKR